MLNAPVSGSRTWTWTIAAPACAAAMAESAICSGVMAQCGLLATLVSSPVTAQVMKTSGFTGYPSAGSRPPRPYIITMMIIKAVRPSAPGRGRGSIAAIHHAALHHECDPMECGRVGERVAVERDEVGIAAGLDGSDVIQCAEQVGSLARGGEDGPRRAEAAGDHQVEFHGVVAFADVRAVGDANAGLHCRWEILLRQQVVGELLRGRAGRQQFGMVPRRDVEDLVYDQCRH